MKFSDRIIFLRKQAGLSQEELADKLNVSRQSISKWECGDSFPDTEKLIAIAKLFDLSLDKLVFDKDDENNNIENAERDASNSNIVIDNKKQKQRKTITAVLISLCSILLIAVVVLSVFVYNLSITPKEQVKTVNVTSTINLENSRDEFVAVVKLTLTVDNKEVTNVNAIIINEQGLEKKFDTVKSGDYSYIATLNLNLYQEYKIFAEIDGNLYKIHTIEMNGQNSYTTYD